MAVWGSRGTQARADEIYALARQAGFSRQDGVTATAIALAESNRGVTNAWNPVAPDDSLGLWQINMLAHGTKFGDKDALINPMVNAHAAWVLANGGGDFCAWSTFALACGPGHTAAYRQYLPEARQASEQVSDTPSDWTAIVDSLMTRAQQIPSPSTTVQVPGQGPITVTPSWGDAPAAAAGAVGGAVGGVVAPFSSALAAIAAPFAWLTVPGHWWAIAFIAAGLVLVLGGLAIYLRPELAQAAKAMTA